jgi:hypothetical protein
MRLTARCRVSLLVAFGLAAGSAAPAVGESFKLTLLGGLATGFDLDDGATGVARPADEGPALGLALGFPLRDNRTLEVVWVDQHFDVPPVAYGGETIGFALDTITIGGTVEWPKGRLSPFLSGTGGFTLLRPDDSAYDIELLLAASIGGGVKVELADWLALRLEGRGVAMFTTGGVAGVCGGGCVLTFSGSGLIQLELLAGLAFSF